jgi:pilus assembly protein CpaF
MKRIMIAALALVAASGAFAQLSGNYTWGGSTTVAPFVYAAIEQFQKDNPGVKISYEATGSGAGLTSLLAGQYSLAGSSAVVTADQQGKGAFPIVVAYDGMTPVVNKNVKLSNISSANLAAVFAGKITNWKDLGGQDMKIIVGECRGGEALDMLQAMNTGHDGSMSTGHANTPRDMLSRLETMVLMAGVDLPLRAIREQVSSAVDLIVHQSRMKDGSRRIEYITEVQGMEGDIVVMQDVFLFEQTGVADGKIQGRLKATGIRPKFVEKFEVMGIHLPRGLFGFA